MIQEAIWLKKDEADTQNIQILSKLASGVNSEGVRKKRQNKQKKKTQKQFKY